VSQPLWHLGNVGSGIQRIGSSRRAPALARYYVPGLKAEALVDRVDQAFEARYVGYVVSLGAAAPPSAEELLRMPSEGAGAAESKCVRATRAVALRPLDLSVKPIFADHRTYRYYGDS
jgi:hypothetical protein